MDIFKERAALRHKYLECVYTSTNGNRFKSVDMYDVADAIGISWDEAEILVTFLRDKKFIENRTRTQISITHDGIDEIEQIHITPEKPSQHFSAGNTINIGIMTNSAIQQGSNNATQSLTVDESGIPDILSIVESVKLNLPKLKLGNVQENDLQAEIDTVTSQLKSSNPKKAVLKESFNSIRNILEGAAGSIVAQAIINQIVPLLNKM